MERLKQFWNRRLVYWNRDRIILNDLKRPAKKDRVNLHWYSCNRSDKKENFGDYLSPFVYQYMLEYFHLDAEQIIGGAETFIWYWLYFILGKARCNYLGEWTFDVSS